MPICRHVQACTLPLSPTLPLQSSGWASLSSLPRLRWKEAESSYSVFQESPLGPWQTGHSQGAIGSSAWTARKSPGFGTGVFAGPVWRYWRDICMQNMCSCHRTVALPHKEGQSLVTPVLGCRYLCKVARHKRVYLCVDSEFRKKG